MSKLHLKINSLNDKWHDRDHVLLHASFQILSDFMEKEKPGEIMDWSYDKSHHHAWREMNFLYSWWKNKRPARKDPMNDKRLIRPPFQAMLGGKTSNRIVWPDKKKYAAYYRALKRFGDLEDKRFEEDEKNLQRLVKIRRFLWI